MIRAGVPGARSELSSAYLLMIRNLGPEELFANSSVNPPVLTAVSLPFLYPCLEKGNVNGSSCFRASETYRATKWKRISAINGHYEQCPEQSKQSWSDLSSCTRQGRQGGTTWAQTEERRLCWLKGFILGKCMNTQSCGCCVFGQCLKYCQVTGVLLALEGVMINIKCHLG